MEGSTDTPAVTTTFSLPNYLERLQGNHSAETCLTAKVKVKAEMDGKSIATNGNLRMKKDDVIQISLVDPLVGIAEIGRMEFTKDRVLIIDRVNKQYIDVPYADADFLHRANVDFYTLQSLFWNEVFQPGANAGGAAAIDPARFTVAPQADAASGQLVLNYADRLLSYQFHTRTDDALLVRTDITSPTDHTAQFSFDYADFASFEGVSFPRDMVMSFVMGNKAASLSFTLSSLRNNSDWATRTQAPAKYTQANPEKILRTLVK